MSTLSLHAAPCGHTAAGGRAALLEVRGATKRFGATLALDDVSIAAHAGEIHCVLGENGAGKSSLGKVIAGLYRADAGVLVFDGAPVQFANPGQARAMGIAIVYQELSLVPDLSIRANFWLGSEGARLPLARVGRRRETPRVREVLAQLGVELDPETRVKDLPVTTQQLLEIGKALMHRPRLVVFDEPTAMLGAIEKQRFFSVLRTLRDNGIASLLITHHIDDVTAVGDRVTVMRNGRVVESFPMTGAIDAEHVLERLTGRRGAAAVRSPRTAPAAGESAVLEISGLPGRDDGGATVGVHRGGIVGLYGVVGCGAERVVRAAAGVQRARDFSMRLNGRPFGPATPAEALRAGISYLPAGRQANAVFPTRSIRENLMLSQLRRVSRLGFINRRRETSVALDQLRASAVKFADLDAGIDTLSGGNQQKVLLARAMAGASALLVLEEPTAGVDIDAKQQIHERIRAASRAGLAVLVLSSDLPETLALCDVVYTFFAGTVMDCHVAPAAGDHDAILADILGQRSAARPEQPRSQAAPTVNEWSLQAT
ncbi:sugar ABC transporter ATP-binding protein [Verticiella sediminum]|uniref:Sugar ABC transporter ATP-binding protein n=1 Tax=Verticiella sediminum TaxID=1247510 RepID=A0A556AWL6_9BURK|nr:sugar ABC transporter ATP-binding protein [Verticiella sediminum]TSH97338.1 sugar ABC transporter ATP-binding protein [Verticiella sediminum]